MFHNIGVKTTNILNSIIIFFVFIGHLCESTLNFLAGKLSISWKNIIRILYSSGVGLFFPMIIVSAFMAVSLSLNTFNIFERFGLQRKALPISQDILTQDLLPLLIGFVLCIQSSLNVITASIKLTKFHKTPETVVMNYILPIMIGINATGLLLYAYLLAAIYFSLYLVFHYVLGVSEAEYLSHITYSTTISELCFSLLKTILNTTIVGLTVGYYYYRMVISNLSLRKAVSRIFTRGSLWLALCGVYWKFLIF